MADSFRASFVLALKDDLSAGLRQVEANIRHLRDMAKSLGFKPLEGADAIVNRVDRDVSQLNRDLGTTARQAETAAGALRRLSAADMGRDREQTAALRRQTALAKQAAAAAGFASGPTIPLGYASQPVPSIPPPPVPFNRPPPVPPRPSLGQRLGGAWQSARGRFGAANEQIGLAGGAMAGISLMEPIRQAAEFENVLTHIAITAGATADQVQGKVAEMAKRYREMALSVNQTSHDVAESAQFLITTSIGEAMTNQLLPIIAKAATAYNTPMRDAVQGAFSMHEELGIAPEDMQGALSAAALAAKQGHFSFSDISSFLPPIAAQASHMAGLSGREGLNVLLSALETSRRGAGSSGQAATNLQDFLGYINAPIGNKSFAKEGIDLGGLLQNAEKAGINPIEAVVFRVKQLTEGMSKAQEAATLGKLFHNQEARIFVATMLHELQYYEDTRKKISTAGEQTIQEDFEKAQNLHTRLVKLSETSHQLTQKLGDGFSWVVPIGTALLGGVLAGLGWMDTHLPGVSEGVTGLTGGMLGLVAVMGVLGTVAGPVKAGFALLRGTLAGIFSLRSLRLATNPFTALVLMSAAAAYDIWQHWDKFKASFAETWTGIKQIAGGDIWAGIKTVSDAVWGPSGTMHRLMDDFVSSLPDWGKRFAEQLGAAMQQAYAGWAKFFSDLKSDMQSLGNAPAAGTKQLFPDRQQPIVNPDGVPLPQAPAHGALNGKPAADPMLYQRPGGAAHRIHITFESDTPGRASARHVDEGEPARGPMLLRA